MFFFPNPFKYSKKNSQIVYKIPDRVCLLKFKNASEHSAIFLLFSFYSIILQTNQFFFFVWNWVKSHFIHTTIFLIGLVKLLHIFLYYWAEEFFFHIHVNQYIDFERNCKWKNKFHHAWFSNYQKQSTLITCFMKNFFFWYSKFFHRVYSVKLRLNCVKWNTFKRTAFKTLWFLAIISGISI